MSFNDQLREELRRTASDLSDIPAVDLARIQRGFAEAYKVADEIRSGVRSPLR